MLRIYNTLTRKVEDFSPQDPPNVSMYSCGPTVYDYQHIGHMRRYVGDDILKRVLAFNNYNVKHVMNITDVGHLTSDADEGQDKMEEGAKKLRLSVWDLAKKFEEQFFSSAEALNIEKPDQVMKATDYIDDQIALVEVLEKKGFTYKTSDGIYFDTSKFKDYGKLSTLDEIKEGARIAENHEKINPRDFALWKFSPAGSKRQMEWNSPWGKGFPGWHLECSAMSMRAFGPTIDIHTGGIDHISIHHQNEIAQSEAATGKPFVKYWVHHNFLLVNGQKMSKSLGNFITVQDVVEKGFNPVALRYLYLQTHYRQEMNFTWEALEGADAALERLINTVAELDAPEGSCEDLEGEFMKALEDDLNAPKALSILWETVRSGNPSSAKHKSILEFDKILGLGLADAKTNVWEKDVPEHIMQLVDERNSLRKTRKFNRADQIRHRIKKMGYEIQDDFKTGKTKVRRIVE